METHKHLPFFPDNPALPQQRSHPNPIPVAIPVILKIIGLSNQNHSMLIWNRPRQTKVEPGTATYKHVQPGTAIALWYPQCYMHLWCRYFQHRKVLYTSPHHEGFHSIQSCPISLTAPRHYIRLRRYYFRQKTVLTDFFTRLIHVHLFPIFDWPFLAILKKRGVFYTGPPLKSLKYKQVNLGRVRCI